MVVKWQANKYDCEVDTEQPPVVFKTQLYSLTGVPIERQKVILKGKTLPDDDWSRFPVKEGAKVMMMGSADAIPEAPAAAPGDAAADAPMDVDEDAAAAETPVHGTGLANLGNTCYMNSCLQCLYSVPQLRADLAGYAAGGGPGGVADRLTLATRELFGRMADSKQPIAPTAFLQTLRLKYPQFAQQQNGMFMQQDAEECWTQLLYSLRERLDAAERAPVKELFGLDMKATLKCEESEEEKVEEQCVYTMKCNITKEVNHLHEGLKLSLVDDREKHSEKLGRTAVFKGTSQITNGLPEYLTVQQVRFLYRRDTQKKAKILRMVKFSQNLDVYDFCDEALKAKLAPFRKAEDVEELKAKKSKTEGGSAEGGGAGPSAGGANFTGRYTLQAILTHKGRMADSGHYVSWVKQDDGKWVEFDDDKIIPVEEEDIVKLNGGGDWHMAYLMVFKAEKN